jgi:hypothetical protein
MSWKNPISSGDPEAIPKLQAKIDAAEALQVGMKAANKIVKSKKLSDDEKIRKLVEDERLDESRARALLVPDFMGRVGFPGYELTNNNANIRRMKGRIEELRQAPTETTEQQHGDITVVENVEANRVQIIFPDKPPAETRTLLKRNGFKWAPSQGAWQRHLNANGLYATKQVMAQIEA